MARTKKNQNAAPGKTAPVLEQQITAQAEKVEQLKWLKAAYLQRMFVW